MWTIPDLWQDGECFIIGGGPSMPRQFGVPEDIINKVMNRELPPNAYAEYLEPILNKHIIAVNNAYQISNNFDILFFGDRAWYLKHKIKIADFPGLKVSCNPNSFKDKEAGIKMVGRDKSHPNGISTNKSKVAWNRNSGMAAINLAVHLGVKKIILLGFDMCFDKSSKNSHWHGHHRKPSEKMPIQPFAGRLKKFPTIAQDAKRLGIEILNANPSSAIDVFPKIDIKEIL